MEATGKKGGQFLLETEKIARLIVKIASEKQAVDIVMLDVGEACSFADYFVICSGDTSRHIEAVQQSVIS